MNKYLSTLLGRFRLIAFLEGLSLIILVFIAVPMKYMADMPGMVKAIGPIHGVLFIAFIFFAIRISFEEEWKFFKTTWKVLLSSFIPFGTFYIDHKILKPMEQKSK